MEAGVTTEYGVINATTGKAMFTTAVRGGVDIVGSAEWYATKIEAKTEIKSRTITVSDWGEV